MSLYRTHRPADFAEMRGNEAAIQSVEQLLSKPDHPRAYGIFGPSGCGKTTLARIMATKLGASELSIHEINSSDNRGIDTAREIQERMKFRSADGAPTVFIIDEVHRATPDWQNAMLKPLEDTPSHVYFFLCTTEPAKLIKAIHTRLTSIEVKSLPHDEIIRVLKRVIRKEKFDIPDDIIDQIAVESKGSSRQALVYLEKVAALDDPKLMAQAVNSLEEEKAESIELCRMLLSSSNWADISKVLQSLKDQDPESIRRVVIGYMSSVLLKSGKMKAGMVLENFENPTYDMGFPGIVLSAFRAFNDINE